MTIGTYPPLSLAEARKIAKRKLADVQRGSDPAAEAIEERRQAEGQDTFAWLAETYLEKHARAKKRPRSVKEDERNIQRELLSAWGERKASDISRKDVIALIDRIAERRRQSWPIEFRR